MARPPLVETLARLEALQDDLFEKIDALDKRVKAVIDELAPQSLAPQGGVSPAGVTPAGPDGPTC